MKTITHLLAITAAVMMFVCCTNAQTFTVLYAFQGPPTDGAGSWGGLVHDASGNLFGTSEWGGPNQNGCCGTIFKLDRSGKETILYVFSGGADGAFPQAGLVRDKSGNLYGTTHQNYPSGNGAVFKLDMSGSLTVLYSFNGGTDGGIPIAGLIRDAKGNLYGTTNSGGDLSCPGSYNGGCGVVYKVSPSGQESVLSAFHGGTDGAFLTASLVMDSSGNLYGTAPIGGDTNCNAPYGCGIVFKLDPHGNETVLHRFSGTGSDGSFPSAGLLLGHDGKLYGTTAEAGVNGGGTVFKMDTAGNETVLFSFNGNDGFYPVANLISNKAGDLYGTTEYGGISPGYGVVFKVTPSGKETVLHAFQYQTDGGAPMGPLMFENGILYGTTSNWGPSKCQQYGCGTVFKLRPSIVRLRIEL